MKNFYYECKLFYKRNKFISRVGIIAVVIFISYIITYNMPDIFGIEPLYNGFYNLAIGYIGSMVFYIIQVYMPTITNERKSFALIYGELETLYGVMGELLLIIECFYKAKGNNDFIIDSNNYSIMNRTMAISFIEYNPKVGYVKGEHELNKDINFCKEFTRYENIIKGIINRIQGKTISGRLEDELIYLLAKLQTNKLCSGLNRLVSLYKRSEKQLMANEYPVSIIMADDNHSLKEFIDIYNGFNKFDFTKVKFKVIDYIKE